MQQVTFVWHVSETFENEKGRKKNSTSCNSSGRHFLLKFFQTNTNAVHPIKKKKIVKNQTESFKSLNFEIICFMYGNVHNFFPAFFHLKACILR